MTDDATLDSDGLVESARRAVAPASDLDLRLAHLNSAVESLASRTPGDAVDNAATVVSRATARLRLSADHTVVALAGATGSGKSSTFNALSGLDVAAVGVRRPTTSWAMACLWGSDGAAELLEWLGIPQRHQVVRDSLLDNRDPQPLQGMVLLDLPDHDSTEVAHRLEVDRLVHLADVIVWVMDPQKYADAAIHDRLLRPNVRHAAVMVAVINHIDEVDESGRDRLYRDARRLLDADGLSSVPLIVTSARFGTGVDQLRAELGARIAQKAASRTRISADVDVAAQRLSAELGLVPSRNALPALRDRLLSALEDAREQTASAAQMAPEVARTIVRSELREFTAGTAPAVATSITDRGLSEVDNMLATLRQGAVHEQSERAEASAQRGVSTVWKMLFFLLFVAGALWLAAALVKHVPNEIGAASLAVVALIAFLLSLTIRRRGEHAPPQTHQGAEAVIASAVDRTVMAAVGSEVTAYENAAADLRAALSH